MSISPRLVWLNREVILSLGTGGWIRDHANLLMTGLTGIGKSWLASAFVQSACRWYASHTSCFGITYGFASGTSSSHRWLACILG